MLKIAKTPNERCIRVAAACPNTGIRTITGAGLADAVAGVRDHAILSIVGTDRGGADVSQALPSPGDFVDGSGRGVDLGAMVEEVSRGSWQVIFCADADRQVSGGPIVTQLDGRDPHRSLAVSRRYFGNNSNPPPALAIRQIP